MKFLHLTEAGSTNDEARRLAEQGEGGPLWLRADMQTGGRGRNGRVWTSVSGNLYASAIYPLGRKPLEAAQLGFAAALAISNAIKVYAPTASITLKWPNDVLVDGAKISGILVETGQVSMGASTPFAIVGIGLNLLSHPADTLYPATHLLRHIPEEALAGPEPIYTGTDAVLAVLSAKFDHWRDVLLSEGFGQLRDAWTAQAQGLGECAQITLPNRSFEAKLLGLGENGELRIEHANGTVESIYAGDVFPSAPQVQDD